MKYRSILISTVRTSKLLSHDVIACIYIYIYIYISLYITYTYLAKYKETFMSNIKAYRHKGLKEITIYICIYIFNPLNPELNPICYLLALLGAHHFLHVSRIRVKLLSFRRLMSYTYGAPILDVSRSHTTTQHSR